MNTAALLQLTNIQKRFGATVALDGVDLEVGAAEVHALIGENGAGKSTLMKILSAMVAPDSGSIRFRNEPYHPADPLDARKKGIAHIHQELSLCPHLSVAENIFLGVEPERAGWLQRKKLNEAAAEILESFHHSAHHSTHHPTIDPQRRVADLPIASRQIVEICRALAQRAALILMDEPTSSLPRSAIEPLFEFIRRLRNSGISIIYISHFLEEIREIADNFTVLRDGKSVLRGSLQEVPNDKLIAAMVGRPVRDLFPARNAKTVFSEIVLRVTDLSAPPAVRRATFDLHRGEILGITGLIGAGRTEMLRALFGLDPAKEGTLEVFGEPVPLHTNAAEHIARGIGYLSEDRKGEGLALTLSLSDNITLTNFSSCSRYGWIDLSQQENQAQQWATELEIKTPGMQAPVQRLSGGNQQKVAFARLLHQNCAIFLLDEPTRGIDVGSKAQIYELILTLARSGKAILMVSSYLPELFGICDRLAVMSRGYLGPARPIGEWTPETVLQMAIGGEENGSAFSQEQQMPGMHLEGAS